MARFAVFVTRSPFDSRNAESALAFCEAALQNGHEIAQVFFYQSGVHNGSSMLQPNSDEFDTARAWSALKSNFKVPLYLCVTAAERRGIANADYNATENEKGNAISNISPDFESVGMSEFFSTLHDDAIKVVQF